MLMDALYDFQYHTLLNYFNRMVEADKFALPTYEQVVASQEDLLKREQLGQYLFDGKEAGEADENQTEGNEGDNAELEDGSEKLQIIGDGSKVIFLGYIQCHVEN